jgi:hypothetical protein
MNESNNFVGYITNTGVEFNAQMSSDGKIGPPGPTGQDGYTPVKGTDYFTAAEIADIEADVVSQIDLSGKQDKLTAGENITIDSDNVISSTGGGATYTAGSNIQISDENVISATDTTDYNDLTNKPSIPQKVSDLQNDSGFITSTVNNLTNYYTKAETYTKAEVNTLVSSIPTMDIVVVQTLPIQDISNKTIYLLPDSGSTQGNAYLEYIYVNGAWELIGSTQVDLTDYYTKTETNTLLGGKQNTLTAGTNITITGDTIDATDTTYSAFTGTDGVTAGTAGLVPAPTTSDTGKYLKSDGTWGTVTSGTTDYTSLSNKPSINSVTLSGNKTSADLGIPEITYGNTDLTPGVSQLDEGTFYFVYE